jgi:hypothetical protein
MTSFVQRRGAAKHAGGTIMLGDKAGDIAQLARFNDVDYFKAVNSAIVRDSQGRGSVPPGWCRAAEPAS